MLKKIACCAISSLFMLGALAQNTERESAGFNALKPNMNLKLKPGNDFYQYAAGRWMDAHPLTPQYSRYSQFEALTEANREKIKTLILNYAEAQNAPGSIEQKIGSLYNLAMDSVRRNNDGFAPLSQRYQAIQAISDLTDFYLQLAQLKRIGVPAFMGIYATADLKNSSENLLYVSQGGMGLSDPDLYSNTDAHSLNVMKAYRVFIQQLFVLSGIDADTAQKKAEIVLNLEKRIAQKAYNATKRRNVQANYNKITFAQLLKDYPEMDWGTLFYQMGIPAVQDVCICQPEPIAEICQIIKQEPIEALKVYLSYKLIADAATSLSDDFAQAHFEFYGKVMSGQQEQQPRWKQAITTVEGVLGMAVGKLYVETYFPETSKQRMLQMISHLQLALKERIQQQAWMSEATKVKALEKLNAFHVKVGYPDTWRNYDELTIDEHLSYYENLALASEFLLQEDFKKRVNQPVDKDEWLMTPQTINAYYNPTTNEICFPAGILQPPFFNADADDAVNYGAIGVVIGHEMTHGFDDQGAQFDKDGNLRNWWTEQDKTNFAARQQVLVDYFSSLEDLPGLNVNGTLTLGENTADHGGLKIAYNALQHALKNNPTAPIEGFTPQQRFFLSYGLIWAQNIRPERVRQHNKVDPHTSARWRVNGALPHIDAWYDAFGIKKSNKLYIPKAQRADVW